MAAPSSTTWGSIRGSGSNQGRIGINLTYSDTATTRSVTIAIWYWTKYGANDTGNTFMYGWSSSPNISLGSKAINTTVSSGAGWSTSNQVHIGTFTKSYAKGTSSSSQSASASFKDVDWGGGSGSVAVSFTIPALASYSITYNANGGSGAPGAQTKWYGTNITISSVKPTRTGYSFQGWATSASGGVSYASGATYSGNAALTLYAVWKANTYTVSYNANGGTGAPGNQTKTYGVNLTLSSTKPTRTNYNFKGWGTSAGSTTVSYAPGATYTSNSAITLYAIWELAYTAPRITKFTAQRCTLSGSASETGEYIKVDFSWATDKTVSSILINSKQNNATNWTLKANVTGSGTSGSVSRIVGGTYNAEYIYNVQVVVADSGGSSSQIRNVEAMTFTIDLLSGGKGVAFGKPASKSKIVDSAWNFCGAWGTEGDNRDIATIPSDYASNARFMGIKKQSTIGLSDGSTYAYLIGLKGWSDKSGGVAHEIAFSNKGIHHRVGKDDTAWGEWNVMQRLGPRTLWSGGWYMTAGHTVELSESIAKQEHGIVLIFSSYYDGSAKDEQFTSFFIPKNIVDSHNGVGVNFILSGHWDNAMKYLYIHNDHITGNAVNGEAGRVVGGVTYNNNKFVLRYVVGV